LLHNLIIVRFTYMHESKYESSTNAISLIHSKLIQTHLILYIIYCICNLDTFFFEKCKFIYMQSQTNV
jgi:hypothetical protein